MQIFQTNVDCSDSDYAKITENGSLISGVVLLASDSCRLPDSLLAAIAAKVEQLDSEIEAKQHQYPASTNPTWGEICDLLDLAGESKFSAHFGGSQLWDVRIDRSESGMVSWSRTRQGLLQSSSEFWK